MPIYEFKCMKCGSYTELLIMNEQENKKVSLECSKCNSKHLERVISTTNYNISTNYSKSNKKQSKSFKENRTCSNGSCTTYNIPGI